MFTTLKKEYFKSLRSQLKTLLAVFVGAMSCAENDLTPAAFFVF